MTERGGVGRGRVWRTVAGVAAAASMSVAGAQGVWADEATVETAPPPVAEAPETDTAAPPVVESSAPVAAAGDEPVVAVGPPPVPPTTVTVAVGPPPVPPTHHSSNLDTDGGIDAPEFGSAVAGALVSAALAHWLDA